MPPISVLIKPSSGLCNMKCDYCFYCDETKKRARESYGFMTEQTLKNVIRKTMLHSEKIDKFSVSGWRANAAGNPFFEKAMEYQKQYNKHGIYIYNALPDEWISD